MARLWIHRARLQLLDKLLEENRVDEPEQLWQRTSLDMMQENAWALEQEGKIFSALKFKRDYFITENLPWARQYLLESRKIDPMESQTHLMMGQVNAIIGNSSTASENMERAIMLAPNKVDLKYLCGFYYLQTGNSQKATKHLRDLLDYSPIQFRKVMRIIFGGAQRSLSSIDEMTVAEKLVPDNPRLLYMLAKRHLPRSSPARRVALNRALSLLSDVSPSDREMLLLKAEILFESQRYVDSIEQFQFCLDSMPDDYKTHIRVAKILLMLSDLETAETKLNYVVKMANGEPQRKTAQKMLEQIEELRKQQSETSQ